MVEEGIILEIKNNYFIVMDQHGNFIKLKYKRGSYEGQKIFFTREDILRERKYTKLSTYAAALIIILIPAFILMNLNPTHASAVMAVDINPSMEFIIDKDETVIEMRFLNKEAEQLINSKWKNKQYSEVLLEYLHAAEAQGYLADGEIVMFSCTILNEDIDSVSIQHRTEDALLKIKSHISYIYSEENEEVLDKARKEKVSTGKYQLFEEIQKTNPESVRDELKNKSLEDLISNTKKFKLKQNKRKEEIDNTRNNDNNNKNNNNNNNNPNNNGNNKNNNDESKGFSENENGNSLNTNNQGHLNEQSIRKDQLKDKDKEIEDEIENKKLNESNKGLKKSNERQNSQDKEKESNGNRRIP